ncbi:hypothetical protein NT01EI_1456 [Edwardsiella ictaluri 93-146]|uniref:Uncharacterized protein n=1 Tax=Edwardsiella ictaluri (strain 93-146) TaxID=634503 RepID=C5BDU5_EDWI9|nr:hypothetical protein NT01EI_1456 [Edwardsiella ictaluri 93-146]
MVVHWRHRRRSRNQGCYRRLAAGGPDTLPLLRNRRLTHINSVATLCILAFNPILGGFRAANKTAQQSASR